MDTDIRRLRARNRDARRAVRRAAGRLRVWASIVGVTLVFLAGCGERIPEEQAFEQIVAMAARAPDVPEGFDKAARRFLKRARREDLRQSAAYAYGRALQTQGRWIDALKAYEKADTSTFPVRDFVQYREAESQEGLKRYDEAIQLYRSILNEFPSFPLRETIRFRIGKALMAAGRYDEAARTFERLIDSETLGREARYRAGLAYVRANQPQEAFTAFEETIQSKTNDALARESLEQIRAITTANPALKLTRWQQFVHGQVLQGAGKRAEARTLWEKVAAGQRDELATRARYEIARSFMRDRRFSTAVRILDELARTGHPNYRTRALFQRALANRRRGYRTRALREFRAFIAENPWSSLVDDAMMEYGWTLRDAGSYASARKVYDDLVKRFPKSRFAPEAAWLSAWCEIKLGRYAQAISLLNRLIDAYPQTEYAGRGYFWLGKMHERLGNWDSAAAAYRQVVERNTYYYAARAEDRLKALESDGKIQTGYVSTMRRLISESSVSLQSLQTMPYPRVRTLQQVRDYSAAIAELKALVEREPDQKPLLYYHLIRANRAAGRTYEAYLTAYRFSRLPQVRENGLMPPAEVSKLLYPIPFQDVLERVGREFDVDPRFLAAMIREESRFNPEAVSWAGAYGLMQVMPETGRRIAKALGINAFRKEMLLDPETNIRLGAWYVRFLLDMFGGNLALVSGAYNAGEGRMGKWRRSYSEEDLDEFIEQVPFDETRNHIKKVMHAYHIYQRLYGNDGDLRAGADEPAG